MQLRRFSTLSLAIAAGAALTLTIARADESPFPTLPTASIVGDDTLATMRGRYVAPGDPRTGILAAAQSTRALGAPGALPTLASSAASPLAKLSGSGSVTYFGIAMVSNWAVSNGSQTAGDAVGLSVGINAASHSVTIHSWSTGTNGGIPAATGTDSVTGPPALGNLSSGVGQSVQIAGNGNTATNEATVSYGSAAVTLTPVPVINTCGAQCTVTTSGDVFGVSITTPRGVVSQSIGNGEITQSVAAWSDMNAITNQLSVDVQATTSASGVNSAKMATILSSLTGIP